MSDEPQEEDSDSNAVVAESALDRIACGLGGKTVFPQIMNLTPGMLQVATMLTLQKTPFIRLNIGLENVNFKNMLMILSHKVDISLNIGKSILLRLKKHHYMFLFYTFVCNKRLLRDLGGRSVSGPHRTCAKYIL